MFVSDTVVFVELHKTGGTHIRNALLDLVGGECIGKHNQIEGSMLGSGRVFLGSVRDPWEWYVSLWAFGCDGKGSVHNRVTRPGAPPWDWRGWLRHPRSAAAALRSALTRDPERWKRVYADPSDTGAFREWLAMMHDPRYRRDYVEGYGTSPVSDVVGLLTYRYLKLFCCPLELTPAMKALSSFPAVQRFEQEHCFIDHFIRNEQLEQDLLAALTSAAVRMPEENVRKFRSAPRTNVSSRNRRTGHYYDAASRQLVLEREQLMIDRFGYRPPALETEAAAGGTAAAQPQAASS